MANKEEKEAEKLCMSLLSLCVSWSVDKNVFTSHLLVIPTALQLIFFTYLGPIRISQIVKVCRIIWKRYLGQHIHICPLPRSLHFFCDCLVIIQLCDWCKDCNYFYQTNGCPVVCCQFYDIISKIWNSFSFQAWRIQYGKVNASFSNLFWLAHICLFYHWAP